jgi:hypothetical protein
MTAMKHKPMTIDDLAGMVQKGFRETQAEIGDVRAEMHAMETRLDHDLKAIRKQLLGVVYRDEFEDLQERVKDLENMLAMPSKKAAA